MEKERSRPDRRRQARLSVARTLLINGLAPYLIYVAVHAYASSFTALLCSAVPPMLESIWSVFRRGRLDVMAILVLGGIALGLGLMTLGGDARLLLVRESLVTGIIGLVFLGSLVLRRPLIYYLARESTAGDDPERLARWDHFSALPPARRGIRWLTLVWGTGLLVEAAVRVDMAESMAIDHFLAISPFVQYGLTGLLIAWTVWYSRLLRRAVGAETAAAGGGQSQET